MYINQKKIIYFSKVSYILQYIINKKRENIKKTRANQKN